MQKNDERGMALIAALMIMLLMSALMIGFTTVVMSDQRFRGIDKDRNRAYYGAQSGLEKLTVDLGNLFLTNVAPTPAQIADLANHPPAISGVAYTGPSGVTSYGVTLLPCDNLGNTTCNGTIQNGSYQGLIALKKVYGLDAIAKTAGGGEAHLTRKIESVAIPVFQFGTFSDVDLSLFAGGTFTFGGRIHTNGNLFAAAQDGWTTTLLNKVTAVGDIVRQRMSNGLTVVAAGFNGTIRGATAPNTFRDIALTEGSLVDGAGSAVNTNWPTISLTTYNGNLRNGGCPPVIGCSTPDRGTGAKRLDLPLITVGGTNPDMARRPPPAEDVNNGVLFGERLFGKVSLRILLSDTPGDITNLPTVTSTTPVRLGDEQALGAGLSNDWGVTPPPAVAGVAFLGVGNATPGGGVMTPIARSAGLSTMTTTANTALNANAVAIANAIPNATPSGAFNVPFAGGVGANNYLQFVIKTGAPLVTLQTVNCASIRVTAANRITLAGCLRTVNGGLANVPANATVTITDSNGKTRNYLTTAAVANTGDNVTTRSYVLASTATTNDISTNMFWMQSTLPGPPPDNGWDIVTCTGITANPIGITAGGWPLASLTDCGNSVPQTNAGANVITNAALTAANVGTIGGYIKIEIQKADFTWKDVTMEILNYGFADRNQAGTLCDDPTPNAIIRLQRLRDNTNNCFYSAAAGNGIPISTSSYDYWPNTIFDAREALLREPAPANNNTDVYLGGVMHYVAIDVANLSRWFKNQGPYGAGSGTQVLTNNGYSVYFSDRRNNRDLSNLETGEYGWEDVVNPLSAVGTPNNTLDGGEDFNGNGTLETYGQFPNFLGARNTLPPGPVAPFNNAANIRPTTTLGRAAAMTNRAYLFRHALKLVNGGFGQIVTPGFTVVTENPVYIQGDWNWNATAQLTDPHSETSVIADAVTLLSTAWSDSNAYVNPYNSANRVRNVNWYRLAIIGGKGPAFLWPAAGGPNSTFGTDGGAHNFLRYLEGGNGLTTNFVGSIATFYYSRQATGTYKFGTATVYNAPNRQYNFDTDFLNPATLPPLTPMFRDLNALGFTQELRPGK